MQLLLFCKVYHRCIWVFFMYGQAVCRGIFVSSAPRTTVHTVKT